MERHINTHVPAASSVVDAGLREHMTNIYRTMTSGMLVTAVTAWIVSAMSITTDPAGNQALTQFGATVMQGPLRWVFAFAPLVLLLISIPMMQKLSSSALRIGFYAIAALFGVSMASLVLVFTGGSIMTAFLATAAGFAGLSLWGYTTKRNLGPVGSFLIVGLIGIIILSILNIFIKSSGLAFTVSLVGVFIFAGLTAADTQRAKLEYLSSAGAGEESLSKMVTMNALSLYLDFVNMFQLLLSLVGNRR